MIAKYLRVLAVIILAVVFMPPPPGMYAQEELSIVLGIPWGASSEQARQIMVANGYTFFRENPDRESSTPTMVFKGSYEGMPSFDFFLRFMNGRFWHLEAGISSKDDARLSVVFDNLNKMLTQNYGPITRDESKNTTIKYIWSLNGNSKQIKLAKMNSFIFNGERFSGTTYVTFSNLQLYEAFKK